MGKLIGEMDGNGAAVQRGSCILMNEIPSETICIYIYTCMCTVYIIRTCTTIPNCVEEKSANR